MTDATPSGGHPLNGRVEFEQVVRAGSVQLKNRDDPISGLGKYALKRLTFSAT